MALPGLPARRWRLAWRCPDRLEAGAERTPAMRTFTDPKTLSHEALEEGAVFAPRFGADGLVTAVAVDAAGTVLMVAHMNAEALSRTLETGEVHYYSRSREKLWKKGETSGEVQRLIELRVDCDQDALL